MHGTWQGSLATRTVVARSSGACLRAGILAGLVAGAVAAGFHLVLAEPVIERAIQLERHAGVGPAATSEPLVSRRVQRGGLVVGLLMYGALWGVLFGVLYALLEFARGVWDAKTREWLVALMVGWAVAVFPFLKYPANPPGVGEATTIGYRQVLYVSFIVLSAAGAAIAAFLPRRLHRRREGSAVRPRVVALGLYAVYAVVLYLVMPANPDPIRMPSGLVWTFRAITLTGLVVFWAVLGTVFAWLARARV